MEKAVDEVLYFIDNMEPQHWLYVLAGALLVGYLCMKSLGTKLHY